MRKLFLLLAFTGIVGAASANTVANLTKGTAVTQSGDDKKQKEKKSCDKKKSCCKGKTASAQSSSGCSAAKNEANADVKSSTKTNAVTSETKEKTAPANPAKNEK